LNGWDFKFAELLLERARMYRPLVLRAILNSHRTRNSVRNTVFGKHEELAGVHLLGSIIPIRDIINAASGQPAPLLQEIGLEVSESGVIHSTSECALGVNCGRIFNREILARNPHAEEHDCTSYPPLLF
jgi:hypothetical protein